MTEASAVPQKLLLFRLAGNRLSALGTLKIREIMPIQRLTQIPHSHPAVMGTMNFRGSAVPVIDMAAAVGYPALDAEARKTASIIVTDIQRQEIGFLVRSVDRIVEANWKQVQAPPRALGDQAFITGLLQIDNDLYVVHNNLGDLWRMHGPPFFMHALRCYCEALRANRLYVPAWQGMADTCWDMSDFQRALGYYQQVLALQPDHPKAASGLGLCYKALGFRQEATLAFAAAVQKRPDDPLALMHYASCLAECGALVNPR